MSRPASIDIQVSEHQSPESSPYSGLGLAGLQSPRSSSIVPDSPHTHSQSQPSLLSPKDGPMPRYGASATKHLRSPSSSLASELSPENAVADDTDDASPFHFQSRTYTPSMPASRSLHKSVVSQVMGQRRGHRYKHSSVSHQIFLEPAPRAPLRLPASLPIPTVREGWASMSRDQTLRISWCFGHLFVAAYVQWTAQGSLALTALSHLIFYDAIGAFLCAGVEVLSNFEVWKRSSIRHPFGLERSEVLVGFAMSILLLFMGFDLISHNASHILESSDDSHEAHRPHTHVAPRVSAGSLDLTIVLAMGSTLVSAVFLQNHARMARSMRFGKIAFLPALLNNPSHLLTLSCSALLLGMPLLSLDMYVWLDRALSTGMAVAMCALGTSLVRTLGGMLLMSYTPPSAADGLLIPGNGAGSFNVTSASTTAPSPTAAARKKDDNMLSIPKTRTPHLHPNHKHSDSVTQFPSTPVSPASSSTPSSVHAVIATLETDPYVAAVQEAKFWQVHYGLCLANVVLRVHGPDDALGRLRERVVSLVRTRLAGAYGSGGGAAWEVSVEMVQEGAVQEGKSV